MSEINDFVVISISRETARLTRTGFGTPMFIGAYSNIPDRSKEYTDPADMLTDNFEVTDPEYIAALKLMGQTLSPESFKVGRKLTDVNSKATLAFTGTPSAGTWTVTVGVGTATPVETANITYAADDDCAIIKAAIEALAGITEVTVTGLYSTGFVVEFTGVDAATEFRVTAITVGSLTGVTAATVTMNQYGSAVETWAASLNAVIADDDDWYFLMAETRTQTDIEALAAIIETKVKMYFTCSDDAEVKAGTALNVALTLEALAYDRTVYRWSGDQANYPEASWVGGQAPKDPGSVTWKYQTCVGTLPDILTAAEFTNITDANGNTYETVGGVNTITSEAVVSSGEYIDIIRGTDWLQVRMQEGIYAKLINADKIPFTNAGIGMIEGEVMYWLSEGEDPDRGLLVPESSAVVVPDLADVPAAEKALRFLDGITFSATYAGAIHKVGITGKISA